MRSKVLQSCKALVVSFLLSSFAMQVFAMSTMPMAMDLKPVAVAQEECSSDHRHDAPSVTAHSDYLFDTCYSGQASDQACNADHCLMASLMTLSNFGLELLNSESEIRSLNVSADSIDTYPPYYPPIAG